MKVMTQMFLINPENYNQMILTKCLWLMFKKRKITTLVVVQHVGGGARRSLRTSAKDLHCDVH